MAAYDFNFLTLKVIFFDKVCVILFNICLAFSIPQRLTLNLYMGIFQIIETPYKYVLPVHSEVLHNDPDASYLFFINHP